MNPDTPLHPRENPHLIGHAEAERTLLAACNAGKIPHAWLITGVQGLGKATLAYRFARLLLANGAPGASAEAEAPSLFGDALPAVKTEAFSLEISPDHPTFKRVVSGGHADLHVIEPTNLDDDGKEKASWEIRVWQIRALEKTLRRSAAEAGWRVAIIDSADDMNRNAANALLKILEEPPARTVLLLVSHHPGRLLPTIRSRCRQLALRPLPEAEVRKVLEGFRFQVPGFSEENLLTETRNPTPETSFAIALAEGSPGFAARMYAEGGLGLYRDMVAALAGLPRLDIVAVQDFGAELAKKDQDARWEMFNYMFGWFLSKAVEEGLNGSPAPHFAEGERELRARLLAVSSIDRIAEMWEKTARTAALGDDLHMDRALVVEEMLGMLQTGKP